MTIENPIVLVVDDSEADILLMRIVFERAGFLLPLLAARDGAEAISYLAGDGGFGNRTLFPLPTVMLLDLALPRQNGFEVLAWVRQQPTLKRLRIYILSDSNRPEDIRRAYDLGADSFLVKPTNLEGAMQTAKILFAWLRRTQIAPLDRIGRRFEPVLPPEVIVRSDSSPGMPLGQPSSEKPQESASIHDLALHDACRQNEELQLCVERQAAELSALRAEQVRVAKIVRHDVRTPLMTIGGYIDLLLQNPALDLDDRSRVYLLKITEATDRLTRMLDEVVSSSKKGQAVTVTASNGNGVYTNSAV